MKKTKKDLWVDFILIPIKWFVHIFIKFDVKNTYELNDGITWDRKEPFVMLANHTFMLDVIYVPLRFKMIPFIVASNALFNKFPLGIVLKSLTHAVPKSKGASDIRTAKELIKAVRKGYPILIFPEGDTTFFGETNYIEESTYKLIKKLKIDVVTCNVKGGYLSKPRWATAKRKNRRIHMNYQIAISSDEIKEMTVVQIGERIKKYLYNNDYEYQREKMIPHPGKDLAEGFQDVQYICPECESINSIQAEGNDIFCDICNTRGRINDYGFIEGFKFDNLIDWDKYQRQFIPKLRESTIETGADLYYADFATGKDKLIGRINLKFMDGKFYMTQAIEEVIEIKNIVNPTVTMRRNLSFTYQDRNFFIRLDSKAASFIRVSQEKY